jgi:predicted ArsR family transcriptional regulator
MTDDTSRPRGEGGEYVEEITPDDALAVFTDHEPLTAKEVAEELGVVRRTAYNKLDKLKERGDLRKKKVGSRAVVWWRPE